MNTFPTRKRELKRLSKTKRSIEEEKAFGPVVSKSKNNRLTKTSTEPTPILKDGASLKKELRKLMITQKPIDEDDLEFLDTGVTFDSKPLPDFFPY
jgi:hypothetical protein